MADVLESLQSTARYRLVAGLGMSDRDDRIAFAPDDQHWHALGQVQPVRGVDALPAGIHDTA